MESKLCSGVHIYKDYKKFRGFGDIDLKLECPRCWADKAVENINLDATLKQYIIPLLIDKIERHRKYEDNTYATGFDKGLNRAIQVLEEYANRTSINPSVAEKQPDKN